MISLFNTVLKLSTKISENSNSALNFYHLFDVNFIAAQARMKSANAYSINKRETHNVSSGVEETNVLNGFGLWRFEKRIQIKEANVDLVCFYLYQEKRYLLVKTATFLKKLMANDEFFAVANQTALKKREKEYEGAKTQANGDDALAQMLRNDKALQNAVKRERQQNEWINKRIIDLKNRCYFDKSGRTLLMPDKQEINPLINGVLFRVAWDSVSIKPLTQESNKLVRILTDNTMYLTRAENDLRELIWQFYPIDAAFFLKCSFYAEDLYTFTRLKTADEIAYLAELLGISEVTNFNERVLDAPINDDDLFAEIANTDEQLMQQNARLKARQKAINAAKTNNEFNDLQARFNLKTKDGGQDDEKLSADDLNAIFNDEKKDDVDASSIDLLKVVEN